MNKTNLKVLVTRPSNQGRVLVDKLLAQGINALAEPLFDYQSNISIDELKTAFQTHQPIAVIFVSGAAVTFAEQALPLEQWPIECAIAVGKATQKQLHAFGVNAVCPDRHDSEGMLALSELQSVEGKDIFIVRGNGGRELLAEALSARGAKVTYLESYQRVWRTFCSEIAKHWQQQQINCIVITSIAILEYTLQLLGNIESYWREQCLWIVASDRIAQHARQAGLIHVINADGASDQAILAAISLNGSL